MPAPGELSPGSPSIRAGAHLGGQTDPMDLPLVNPLQNSLRGGEEDVDSFAARFNPAGTLALYSTYQGGVDYEWAEGLAVSPSGDIYLTGASTPAYATPEEVFPPLGFAAGSRPAVRSRPPGFLVRITGGRARIALRRVRRAPRKSRRQHDQRGYGTGNSGGGSRGVGALQHGSNCTDNSCFWEDDPKTEGFVHPRCTAAPAQPYQQLPYRSLYWLTFGKLTYRMNSIPLAGGPNSYVREESYWSSKRLGMIVQLDVGAYSQAFDVFASDTENPRMSVECIRERCKLVRREVGPNVPLYLGFTPYLRTGVNQSLPSWEDSVRWGYFISNVEKLAQVAVESDVNAAGILMDCEDYISYGRRNSWPLPTTKSGQLALVQRARSYVDAIVGTSPNSPRANLRVVISEDPWWAQHYVGQYNLGYLAFPRTVSGRAKQRLLYLTQRSYGIFPNFDYQYHVKDIKQKLGRRGDRGKWIVFGLNISARTRAENPEDRDLLRSIILRAFSAKRRGKKPWGTFLWPGGSNPDIFSRDPYERDASGNIKYENGNPVMNKVWLRGQHSLDVLSRGYELLGVARDPLLHPLVAP